MAFNFKSRLEHYTAVANGSKPTKSGSKYSSSEQKAYARGQRDAMNTARRVTAYKHSTPEQRAAYKQQKAAERAVYKAAHYYDNK